MKQLSTLPAFDAWAEVYDTQPNPLLSLEKRILNSLLPDVRGLDILDAGCGTGRWLEQLSGKGPRSLLGVDISPQMLQVAAAKVGERCDLRLGSCEALPFGNGVADLVLSSFVISYLDDLENFAQEVDRVARPGTTVFLSDMHPETEAFCNWKRSYSLKARGWSLQQITRFFEDRGFEVRCLIEAPFCHEERRIFEACGRPDLYESAATLPAIYVLQLRKPPRSAQHTKPTHSPGYSYRLTGGRCALGADTAASASVSIAGKYIHSLRGNRAGTDIDLSGYLLLPGLINAHDHLEFGLFPNLSNGPYQNAAQWAWDIHAKHATVIARHRQVPRPVRLWWGALRNLLCGVTTVCHHNPVTAELVDPTFPVRVVSDFAWAHSLYLEPQLAGKFAECGADLPFIVHAGEGVDEASAEEVLALDRMRALDQRTVLVHGLACTPEAASLINQRGAALILCLTSNEFLFRRLPSLALIRSIDNVVLGSDSPLTAAGDLLDEVRFAHEHIGLDPSSVYAMVTNRAADVLRLRLGEGRIWPGSIADLIAVRDVGLSPAETLVRSNIAHIELVIMGGRIQLAGPALFERLPLALRQGLQLLQVDGHRRWVRAPIDDLLTGAQEALGSDLLVGGKRVHRAIAA